MGLHSFKTPRVRVNTVYVYQPCGLDRWDGRTSLKPGDLVRVVNLHGCPKANTMGHCHVANPETGQFIGLVCCASLQKPKPRKPRPADKPAHCECGKPWDETIGGYACARK